MSQHKTYAPTTPAATAPTRREQETLSLRKNGRVPLGVKRQKLNSTARPGYEERWMNDDRGRIDAAMQGGYQIRTWDTTGKVGQEDAANRFGVGNAVSRVVGTKADGSPLMSYLMEIPKEFYDEDQAAKAKQIKDAENAIFTGANVKEGQYSANSGMRSGIPQSTITT